MPRGLARELGDEVRARARLLAVEGGRPAIAVPEAIDRLQRSLTVVGDAAHRRTERLRDGAQVAAAGGREAGRAGAHLDMAAPARCGSEIREERGGTVDMSARQAEIGRDPVDVGALDPAALFRRLAQAVEHLRSRAPVAALELGHRAARHQDLFYRVWDPRAGKMAGMAGFRVVIAGGGVAGLETMLALDDLASEFVEVEILDPADAFVYRPLLVAEPFGLETHMTTLDLAPIVEAAGGRHIRDALESVQPAERSVTTASGTRIGYDALVVAPGARPVEALPGALTFGADAERGRFGELLGELGRRGVKRLAFVVPDEATWSIAAYELALLTAAECHARRLSGVELSLVTHESAPLELFGADASQLVAARLSEAGIVVRLNSVAVRFDGHELELSDGDSLPVDRVVALPGSRSRSFRGSPSRSVDSSSPTCRCASPGSRPSGP